MKKIIICFLVFAALLYGSILQAQIISAGADTEFSIGAGTIVSADSLELTPDATFSISNNTLSKSNTVNNSTSVAHVNRVYQFSSATNSFAGSLKMYYNNTDINGLSENCLKFLTNDGSSWSIDNNSSVNTANHFILSSSVSGALKEISGGISFPDATTSANGATTFTYGNSVSLSAPSVGNALSFNGSTNYVSLSMVSGIPTSGSVTVEAWLNVSSSSNYLNWFNLGTSGGGYALYIKNNTIYVNNIGGTTWNTGVSITNGTWTHIAFSYDGSTEKLYKNGVMSATSSNGYSAASGGATIGYSAIGSSSGYFAGSIDEVRIWNTALTDSQISASMNSTISSGTSGLQAYFKFDETTGSSAADATGNGNTGTVN
jgi:hypothetical protein